METVFKQLLRKRQVSQSQFARETGLNAVTVGGLANGRLKPWPGQARRIAEALGWDGDTDALWREVDE